MARRTKETPLSQRMRAIDDPTAAFPIGALSGMVKELEEEDSAASAESEVSETDAAWEDSPTGVQPALVLLSLIGGGIVAIALVSVFAAFVFLM